jgi:D-ribose pyranase
VSEMLKTGILNPQLNALLSRVRHTNTFVIADRGFPFFSTIETIDLSLVDDVPRVLDVLRAIRTNFTIGRILMAEEFFTFNVPRTCDEFAESLRGIALSYEPHTMFKMRVPEATGLIRTGDTVPYANMIIQSS